MIRPSPPQRRHSTRIQSSAEAMMNDLKSGEIDIGVLWGPMAGFFARQTNPAIKVGLVGPPYQAVDPRCGVSLEREERRPQHRHAEMVEERGELLLLPLPCGSSYAIQHLGHAFPVLCPARALLARVSLGPGPSLHRLRRRSPGFVRRLPRYYDRV